MSAILSECGTYRFRLEREWDQAEPSLVFVMLNPSTADARDDDPTIRRCKGFAEREGYGGIIVVNCYAFRATEPKVLLRAPNRMGGGNLVHVKRAVGGADVIAAWGSFADHTEPAVAEVMAALRHAKSVRCLGYTQKGKPRHPLMVAKNKELEPYDPRQLVLL